MKRYLLDTNIVIDYLRNKKEVVDILTKIKDDKIFLSVVTVAEYYQGVYRSRGSKRQIEVFDDLIREGGMGVLGFDDEMAKLYGKLQAGFMDKGEVKPRFDLMVAVTCLVNDLILVTQNIKEF